MSISFTPQTIITASAVLCATITIITYMVKVLRWVDRQSKQDEAIKKIQIIHKQDVLTIHAEQTLIVYGLLACLKGLKEQGCNGSVTEAISKIEKYLNEKAHE